MLHEFWAFVLIPLFLFVAVIVIFLFITIIKPFASFTTKGTNAIKLFTAICITIETAVKNNLPLDDCSYIELKFGLKKLKFKNIREAFFYAENLGNDALDIYDKYNLAFFQIPEVDDLKKELLDITYNIRKTRWQNKK